MLNGKQLFGIILEKFGNVSNIGQNIPDAFSLVKFVQQLFAKFVQLCQKFVEPHNRILQKSNNHRSS